MGIFSSIGSAIKSAYNTIKSAITGTKSTASAGMAFPLLPGTTIQGGKVVQNQTPLPNMSTPYGPAVGQQGGNPPVVLKSGSGAPSMGATYANYQNSYGGLSPTPSPVTISGGTSRTSGGTATTTSSTMDSSRSSLGSISASSLASTPSVGSLPSSPGYSSVSPISTAGLGAGAVVGDRIIGANGVDLGPANPADTVGGGKDKGLLEKLGLIPKEESVYDDPEVKRQQAEVRRQQEVVKGLSSQLDNIVAKQQADLLNLREIGSKEGVTETVYGGQQLTINREAAIRALPIQAQIATAQGNLELAQDYLSEITKIKQDQISKDFAYNMEVFRITRDFMTAEEKKKLDAIEKEETRAYNQAQDDLSMLDSFAKANPAQASQIWSLQNTIGTPQFRDNLARVVGALPTDSTGGNFTAQEVRKLEQAGLVNAPRQNQLDYLYGSSSGGTFTPTQTNKGAANAGLGIDTFSVLGDDVKNYYVNLSPTAAQSLKDTIAEVASGETNPQEVKDYIKNNGVSPAVANYLNDLIDAATPQGGDGSFWSNAWSNIKGLFQ